jgi:putative transposase
MGYAHAALRKGRHSSPGQVYLVTFATYRRQPHFADWGIAIDGARHMASPENWRQSSLLAWVLMPDHWHGLVQLGEDDTVAARIGWIKAQGARQLRRLHPGIGRVWARAYHDRALRAEDDLLRCARYLVMNPVRAGLVRRVGEYPFWDAVWVGGKSSRL